MTENFLLAGGYSWTETPERGITVAQLDTLTGAISAVDSAVTEIRNPFHLLAAPSGRTLYVASNVAQGAVHSLAIENGKLLPLNEAPAGDGPIHLCLHPSGGYLVVVNHDSANFLTYQVGEDGRIGEQVQDVTHVKSVPGAGDPHAQAIPHPHMSVFDPAGERLLIADKGTDHVHVYRFDPRTGLSTPQSQVYLGAGFGPRYMAVHPSWRYLYVVNEIQSAVTICGYDPETGALWTLDSVPTVPADAQPGNAPSALVLSPDARFLYAANRGQDSIAIFAVRDGGARLEHTEWFQVGDPLTMFPWDLQFGRGGEVLYVANLIAGTVLTYLLDPGTGTPRPIGAPLQVPGAASVALA
jgi:6-phosphogluconolactonase (cycloisomerase 2 family)